MTGPLIDQIRAVSQAGLETLEIQIRATAEAFTERLKPAERRKLRAARDYLTRRLALWRDLLGDEPELIPRLEALAAETPELRTRRGWSQTVCDPAPSTHEGGPLMAGYARSARAGTAACGRCNRRRSRRWRATTI